MSVHRLTKEERSEASRAGGIALHKKYGSAYMRALSRKGVEAGRLIPKPMPLKERIAAGLVRPYVNPITGQRVVFPKPTRAGEPPME